MKPVKTHFVAADQPDNDTSTNPQRQPQHINDRVQFVPRKNAHGDPEIVFEHGG
jgi:hypothetical protein